jgi:small subunit ribosomal protein S6
MFLLDSGRYAVNSKATEDALLEILTRCGAEVVAKAPWQDGKLAYQIGNHKKGLHYLIYFKMDSLQVTEFTRLCKLSEVVVRHLLISHPEKLFTVMAEALSQHVTGQADTSPMGVNPDKPY